MPIKVRLADGRTVTVNTDDPQAAARAAHTFQQSNPTPARPVDQATDIGLSAAQGAQNIPGLIAGIPGEIQDIGRQGAGVAEYWAHRVNGASDADARRMVQHSIDNARHGPGALPMSSDVNHAVERVTGFHHDPQTVAGEYAKTGVEFIPAAIGGEATIPTRIARVAIPALSTETAGQVARRFAPEAEGSVRMATALATGIGVDAAEGAASRANAAHNSTVQQQWTAQAPIRQLEQDQGVSLTAGERAGDPRAMQREESLRRAGPAPAQAILHDFDNARAPAIAQTQMHIATRGQEPVNPDLGSAGTNLANDLRDQWETAQKQRSQRYRSAMELAGNEPIAPTDELWATVQNSSREHFGNLDNGAVHVIRDLNDEILRGNATYARVERARQALNDELGDAMAKPGNGRQVMAIHRIIDDLDAFAESRVSDAARQQIREARGFSSEMMNMYGQQLRPELSTGHVGRVDAGGRVIRNIINQDMTGEQIIDSILGTNVRPLRSTLAAVQRIKKNATEQTVTNNYSASTAGEGRQVRGAGRQSLRGGRGTRGGQQFDPSAAHQARHGVQLPRNDLQALREAFVYRMRRPLDARTANSAVPFQTLATNLRQALRGPGAEITRIIFNKGEIKQMENHLRLLERAAPPKGNYQPSAPGIAQDAIERSSAALLSRLLGRVPGLGAVADVINDHVVNGRAIRDARAAVATPTPPRLRRTGTPSGISPAYDAAASQDDTPRPLGSAYGVGQPVPGRRLGQQ